MTHFSAHGLTLASEFDLPELPVSEHPPDVRIRAGSVDSSELELDETGHGFACTDAGWVYHFDQAATLSVSAGNEIVVDRVPGSADTVFRLSILGPALGLALIQRGVFVLHASVVDVDGRGVAFLGGHGFGKSTMARLLHVRGHSVLTDDVAALVAGGTGALCVAPGVPQFKLWPDALASLDGDEESSPILMPGVEKRGMRIDDGFATSAVKLERLYILGRGSAIRLVEVPRAEALEAVLPHWYGARFGEALLRSVGPATLFRQCLELIEQAPPRRLERPSSDLSSEAVRTELEGLVLEDLRGPDARG